MLAGECFSGALWWKDLLQLAEEVGFSLPRLVTASVVTVDNKELQDVLGLKEFLISYKLVVFCVLTYFFNENNLALILETGIKLLTEINPLQMGANCV